MREIKFRAWNKRTREMELAIELTSYADGSLGVNRPFGGGNSDDFNVMQYTGLKDKNGVEIYEGDVLCIDDGDEFYFPISYSEKYASFGSGALSLFELMNGIEVKISGNIYENPELLDK